MIGGSLGLTGLAAEIVMEGHRFIAESPPAIMLPPGFAHHHRLIEGVGWSFHVNVRPDYEESLMPAARDDSPAALHVNRLYQRAESRSAAANGWEIENGAMPADQNDDSPVFWKFIDPDHFETQGCVCTPSGCPAARVGAKRCTAIRPTR